MDLQLQSQRKSITSPWIWNWKAPPSPLLLSKRRQAPGTQRMVQVVLLADKLRTHKLKGLRITGRGIRKPIIWKNQGSTLPPALRDLEARQYQRLKTQLRVMLVCMVSKLDLMSPLNWGLMAPTASWTKKVRACRQPIQRLQPPSTTIITVCALQVSRRWVRLEAWVKRQHQLST